MYRGFNGLIFLRQDLDFENDLFQKGFQFLSAHCLALIYLTRLALFLAQFSNVFAKLKMYTISNDFKLVYTKFVLRI